MRASKRLETLLVFILLAACRAQEGQTCGPSTTSTKYEWEQYDYYRVLDLPSVDQSTSRKKRKDVRDHIDEQQIKKAYRRQAQKFHPDKAHKENLTATIEESNQRFARIAEAYEVLKDDIKRKDYDAWLLNCEDRSNSFSQENDFSEGNSWSFSFSNPRKVFENFWDGRKSQQEPIRVHESREILLHPTIGKEILRVYRTEEFASNEDGIYMYRVLVQDFAEQYDRFFGWEYKPLSEATVVEEGTRSNSNFQDDNGNQDVLAVNDYMTPRSLPLVSANGQFYARISRQCELIVASKFSAPGGPDDLIKWTSRTYIPSRAGNCFLSVQGPYLVLATGSPDNPGRILWNSANSKNIDDDLSSVYFARLDNDGNLAVYKETDKFQKSARPKAYLYKRIPNVLKDLAKRLKQDKKHSKKDNSKPYTKCIFATGTFGCNPPARKMVHFAYDVRRLIERTMVNIDSALDNLWDLIEPEEDEDPLDVLLRVAEKAGNSITKFGSSLAKRGAKFISDWR